MDQNGKNSSLYEQNEIKKNKTFFEKNKTVNKLIEADGLSGARRGKAEIATFDATYDIIDPSKTVDISALYNPNATEKKKQLAKDEIQKTYTGQGN